MKQKNENTKLWILQEMRQKNKENARAAEANKAHQHIVEEKNYCSKCKQPFNEPRIVQYYACPHCMVKIEAKLEETKIGCQFYFGFLSQKDKSQSLPHECIECGKVLECMLNQDNSPAAMSEIKKWY